MRYSIDFHSNKISGWVEEPSAVKKIVLSRADGTFIEADVSCKRPDVVSAGIANDETCGFVFPECIDPVKEDGNFFLVEIETGHQNYRKSIFIGNKNKWKERFENFQVSDRRDFTIQEGNAASVFNQNQDIIAFKLLLIRLRRGKRAFGWRGSFSGNVYPEMDSDWHFFKVFYSQHFLNLKEILHVRSLWSVIDTFSDFSSDIERACALSVSNYMYQERFAQTFRRIFNFVEIEKKQMIGQTGYWGYMNTNQLEKDDAYDVFLTKNIEVLEMCPIIKKTFGVIFLESLNSELSIANINQVHSPYLKEAFKFYKEYFEKYMAQE